MFHWCADVYLVKPIWTCIVSDHRRDNCESKQQNKTTCQCTPVDSHLHYLLMYTHRCTPRLHLDVHLDYLLMDSCRCTRGLLVDAQLSGYLSTHIYETVCSCTCMRPPVNSHPQDTTPVAPRLQCESKKLHSFTFVITLSNKALSWQFLAHL